MELEKPQGGGYSRVALVFGRGAILSGSRLFFGGDFMTRLQSFAERLQHGNE
jgi:hypothetical protein